MNCYPTIVRDRFFSDPDQIRTWALCQEFLDVSAYNRRHGVRESWPGLRSAPLHLLWPQLFQDFINAVVGGVLRSPPCRYKANASFQLARESDGTSWVHRDEGQYAIAGLVYLTPNAPTACGTSLFDQGPDAEPVVTDQIGNRYNRLVLYDAHSLHKSSGYFGSGMQDARLTLPFFIELLGSPCHGPEASISTSGESTSSSVM